MFGFGKKSDKHKEEVQIQPEASLNTDETKQINGKKLMILYILDVLKKYSSIEHKLTQADIIRHIKEDYGMDCERKAIGRNIKLLIDYGYDIGTYEENAQGYYLRDKQITDQQAFMIWEALMSSRYISKKDSSEILARLKEYIPYEYKINDSNISGGMTQGTIPERSRIYKSLRVVLDGLSEDVTVMFTLCRKDENNKDVIIEDEAEYSIFGIINVDNGYYVACSRNEPGGMECHRIEEITNARKTSSPARKIRTVPGYERGFDKNLFLRQFVKGYGGETTDFIVKINRNRLSEAYDLFGKYARVVSSDSNSATLDITTNSDRIFYWAFTAADDVEIIEPTAMRFRLKEYFDKMSWKYR